MAEPGTSIDKFTVCSSGVSFSTVTATSTTARSASTSGVVTRTPSSAIRTGSPTISHVSR